jgi:hypothetical protein
MELVNYTCPSSREPIAFQLAARTKSVAKEYMDYFGTPVDLCHMLNLCTPFLDVFLIDADSVNPKLDFP